MEFLKMLSSEHIERFPQFIEKWTKMSLSTEPANREQAEASITLAYNIVGLPRPKQIIWCTSPLSMVITHGILQSMTEDSIKTEIEPNLETDINKFKHFFGNPIIWSTIWGSVRNSLWDNFEDDLGSSVRANIWTDVWNNVYANIGKSCGSIIHRKFENSPASFRKQIWSRIRLANLIDANPKVAMWFSIYDSFHSNYLMDIADSVRNGVGDNLRDSCHAFISGQDCAPWIGLKYFEREVRNLAHEADNLRGVSQIAENAGWWLPCENICLVTERHNILHLDEEGRLHCENGPAIEYPDGFAIYAWHGVTVPKNCIMEPIASEQIVAEKNLIIKHVMIERLSGREL